MVSRLDSRIGYDGRNPMEASPKESRTIHAGRGGGYALTPMLLNPLCRRVREHRGFPVFPGYFPLLGHLPAMMTDALGLMRRAERPVPCG